MPGHEEVIRSLFRTVDGRRWDELAGYFTDDIRYHRPGYDEIVGVADVVHFYAHVRGISAGRHIVEGVVTDGRRGACWGRFTGRSLDGGPLAETFAEWYEFADGRIRTRRTFFFRPAV